MGKKKKKKKNNTVGEKNLSISMRHMEVSCDQEAHGPLLVQCWHFYCVVLQASCVWRSCIFIWHGYSISPCQLGVWVIQQSPAPDEKLTGLRRQQLNRALRSMNSVSHGTRSIRMMQRTETIPSQLLLGQDGPRKEPSRVNHGEMASSPEHTSQHRETLPQGCERVSLDCWRSDGATSILLSLYPHMARNRMLRKNVAVGARNTHGGRVN